MDVRLFISVASNRDWKPKFGASLGCLMSYLTGHGIQVEGYKLTEFFLRAWGTASLLPKARQAFVDEMIANGYTHWLSLDDDMSFPVDIVDQLIKHDKDVVSCNARYKGDDIKGSCLGMDGKQLISTDKTGLEELKTMGGAIFLARVGAFKHIPKPHFQVLWSPEHNDYVGEDVHFAALLRANGVKLYCDHDASQHIGHVGDFEYRWPQTVKLKAVA